jgi:hypothetical protein
LRRKYGESAYYYENCLFWHPSRTIMDKNINCLNGVQILPITLRDEASDEGVEAGLLENLKGFWESWSNFRR